MRYARTLLGLSLLLLALVSMAGCGKNPTEEPVPVPVTAEVQVEETSAIPATDTPTVIPSNTPTEAPPTATPTASALPISEEDLDDALQLVRDFLSRLADGGFREVYGSYLTTAGQQRLADLVLGRLALSNPHISYFELLGAEPIGDSIAVDVTWQESYEGQGLVGTQDARVLLARQDGVFLVDDVVLAEYQPAATPVPPPLPRAEALTNPAIPGEDMVFRATGFEADEIVLTWLELPDGSLFSPEFQITDDEGSFELTYSGTNTKDLVPGRWIWWAQALRDSTRNTGITFEILPPPTPTATPTRRPRPTPAPTRPPATPTPEPRPAYGPPTLLWPELETSRNYNSALVVEFVPVADQLAEDEFYELILVARDLSGNVYGGAAARGKGDTCNGQYDQPCRQLTLYERDLNPLHPKGVDGRGSWFVQVVRQTGPDEFTPISPPSESRIVLLKPKR